MATREGIGDILADGVKKAAERLGPASEEFAVHINGEELPAHDPKADYGYFSCYLMDATPSRHMRWHEVFVPPGVPIPAHDPRAWSGRGEAQKVAAMFSLSVDALGCCSFVMASMPHVNPVLEEINAVTGWDMTVEELLQIGERIANIRQAFNIREGINMLKYKLPPDCSARSATVPSGDVRIDKDVVAREYLEAMDWGLEDPVPSKKKLLELNLENVAKQLWP
jgi:aldehyde:ferredoxin oxidoreductase